METSPWAKGTAEAFSQKQESAESFREPQTVLEVRAFNGQAWEFRLESRMRPEGRVREQRRVKKRGEKGFSTESLRTLKIDLTEQGWEEMHPVALASWFQDTTGSGPGICMSIRFSWMILTQWMLS